MAVDFRTTRVRFDSTSGRPQREAGSVVFGGTVRRVGLAINGFSSSFSSGDHELSMQEINIHESLVQVEGSTVKFSVGFLLRDDSGNIDDAYEGYVDVLVIAFVD